MESQSEVVILDTQQSGLPEEDVDEQEVDIAPEKMANDNDELDDLDAAAVNAEDEEGSGAATGGRPGAKNKERGKKEYKPWSALDIDSMLDTLASNEMQALTSATGFPEKAFTLVAERLRATTGSVKTPRHCRDKWGGLKEKHSKWKDVVEKVRKTSSGKRGWNETKGQIQYSPDVWDGQTKAVKKFRNKTFPLHERIRSLVEGSVARGEEAVSAWSRPPAAKGEFGQGQAANKKARFAKEFASDIDLDDEGQGANEEDEEAEIPYQDARRRRKDRTEKSAGAKLMQEVGQGLKTLLCPGVPRTKLGSGGFGL